MRPPLDSCTVPYPTRSRHKVKAKDSRLFFFFFPCCTSRVLLSCMYWQGFFRALSCGGGPIQTGRILLWRETWQETTLKKPLTLQYVTSAVFLSVPHLAHLRVYWCAAAGELCWLVGPFQVRAVASCCRRLPCLGMVMAVCCSWEMHHQSGLRVRSPCWSAACLIDLSVGACSRRKVMLDSITY